MATLTGSDVTQAESSSAVNHLSSPTRTDWIEFPQNVTSPNRKSGGGSTISTPTLIGPNNGTASFTGYNAQGVGRDWTDGTPTASATRQEGVFYDNTAAVAAGQGIQFTVPADTNTRTLEIYWFAYSGAARVNATLSDSSASAYTNNLTTTGLGNEVWHKTTITYSAASAAQTLTVQLTMQSFASTYGQVGLDAIAYTTTVTSPTASFNTTAQNATIALAAKETFNVSAGVTAQNATVSLAARETFNAALAVTAQNATSALLATEKFPVGMAVTAQNATNSLAATETFPTALAVTAQNATANVQVLQLGTASPSFIQSTATFALDDTYDDWVEWPGFGVSWNSGNLNRRATGASGELADFPSTIGSPSQNVRGNGSGTRSTTYVNGTLGASGSNAGGGIFTRGSPTQGMRFPVPAAAGTRTVKIWAFNALGTAELRMTFADGGPTTTLPLTTTAPGATDWYVITVNYSSPAATTLYLDLVQTTTQDAANTQMGAQAIAISGGPPTPSTTAFNVSAQNAVAALAALEGFTVGANVTAQNATIALAAKETFAAALAVTAQNATANLHATATNVVSAGLNVAAQNAVVALVTRENFRVGLAITAQNAVSNLQTVETFRSAINVIAQNATATVTLAEYYRRRQAAILGPQ